MTIDQLLKRRAVTLVELLVVMVIMVILATIVVAFAPGFQDAQKAARGADQLQMWLVSARQSAKTARVPTGLRFMITNGAVTELQYIQQPPTFTVPFASPLQPAGQQLQTALITVTTSAGGTTATIFFPPPPPPGTPPTLTGLGTGQVPGDFTGGQGTSASQQSWPVQPGDYLVIHGTICCVGSLMATDPKYPTLANQILLTTPLTGNLANMLGTSDYYFVRAARPLTGESTLKLPQDVVIDMTQSIPSASSSTGTFDVLFSPSGEVLTGVFTPATVAATAFQPNNKLIFWVLDASKKGTTSAQDTLIAVDCRTGLVAAQPVNVGGADAYAFTKDGRTSGL